MLAGTSRSAWSYGVWGAVALFAAAASILAAPGLPGLFGAGLAALMMAIAAVDARRFIIPDQLVLLGLGLGLAATWIDPIEPPIRSVSIAALRGAVVALAFLAFRAVYRRIRGREGIGLGDVKLAAVAGVWLDWGAIAIAFDIAALSALAIIGIQAARGQRVSATTAIPFGLFLAPAIWIAWLIAVLGSRLIP